MVGEVKNLPDLPWDTSFLSLTEDEKKFFELWTGITDEEELRKHIVDVAARAYKTYNYPCLRGFTFTKSKIARVPDYSHILRLSRERPGAILLDIGCCLGQDLRQAIADGWPAENTIASDLEPVFWEYGHQLFKTDPKSFKAGFIVGDVFDPQIIEPHDPFYEPPNTPRPDNLQSLKSLTPFKGYTTLAKRLASLLSPEPGSVICGCHRGAPVKTTTSELMGYTMVCHSPESWREFWDGQIFDKGKVKVDAFIANTKRADLHMETFYMLYWSVTRL